MTKSEVQTEILNANIFVIDDEEIATEYMSLCLTEAGFTKVHGFQDPVEAFETLSCVEADLILTDVNMPELGGKFLIRLARKMPHLRDTPIIAITSDHSEMTRDRLLANGVTEVLVKPIGKDQLAKIVTDLLKFHCLANQNSKQDENNLRKKSVTKVKEKEQVLWEAFDRKS
ncbi:MAG: response regulator [Planctomycetota bacterium]